MMGLGFFAGECNKLFPQSAWRCAYGPGFVRTKTDCSGLTRSLGYPEITGAAYIPAVPLVRQLLSPNPTRGTYAAHEHESANGALCVHGTSDRVLLSPR